MGYSVKLEYASADYIMGSEGGKRDREYKKGNKKERETQTQKKRDRGGVDNKY